MTRGFVAKLEDFVTKHDIPLVQFEKGQRKDTVMASLSPRVAAAAVRNIIATPCEKPAYTILGGSGHNAGVINPPAANKHGYWTNANQPVDADDEYSTAGTRRFAVVRDHGLFFGAGGKQPVVSQFVKKLYAQTPVLDLGASDRDHGAFGH